VQELLLYLAIADFTIKDEMVLKTAILAERFAPNMRWYVEDGPPGEQNVPRREHSYQRTEVSLCSSSRSLETSSRTTFGSVGGADCNEPRGLAEVASKLFHALELVSAHETAVKVCSC